MCLYIYTYTRYTTGMCVCVQQVYMYNVYYVQQVWYYTHTGNGPYARTHADAGHRHAAARGHTRSHAHCCVRPTYLYNTRYNNIIYASGRLVKRVRRYIPVFGWLFFFRFFPLLPFTSPLTRRPSKHTHTHAHTRRPAHNWYGWRSFWNHFVYIYTCQPQIMILYAVAAAASVAAAAAAAAAADAPAHARARVRRVWYRYFIL